MPFLLSGKCVFIAVLFLGLGICCYVQSTKAMNPGKYFSASSGAWSLYVNLYIF